MKRNGKQVSITVRTTRTDAALLALVAARVQRSRSDTMRLLIRSAAAELAGAPDGQQDGQEAGHEQR